MNQTKNNKGFAIASLICGITSIVMCCMGPVSVVLGALGILFAVLSHRKSVPKDSMSITGIILSGVGICMGLLLTVTSLLQLPDMLKDPAIRRQYDMIFEQMYGQDFNEFLQEYYGISID